MFLYGSKMILVDILNNKSVILLSMEGIVIFHALVLKFSAFSSFFRSKFTFVDNMQRVIFSYDTNIFQHTLNSCIEVIISL